MMKNASKAIVSKSFLFKNIKIRSRFKKKQILSAEKCVKKSMSAETCTKVAFI